MKKIITDLTESRRPTSLPYCSAQSEVLLLRTLSSADMTNRFYTHFLPPDAFSPLGPTGLKEKAGPRPGEELSLPTPYLFKIMRIFMVHGSKRRAWFCCTASTVLRATVSGFNGGKRLGNLKAENTDFSRSWPFGWAP